MLWDVTITACGEQPGGAARAAEQAKRRKYQDHPLNDMFYPLAAGTYGMLGQAFHDVIDACARRALAARDLSLRRLPGFLALYRQHVACELQRAQGLTIERGAAVVAAVPGWGPMAPTTKLGAVLAAAAV